MAEDGDCAAGLDKLVHTNDAELPVSERILTEPCEGEWIHYRECSQDALMFKGVFMR
eukprot:COSAG05_NODE_438_length_9828_cov_4.712201_4_plen_57_part_00